MLKAGGFAEGGFNFDAKVRRQNVDALDLVYAHIAGIDTLAHGLLIAAKMVEDDKLGSFNLEKAVDHNGHNEHNARTMNYVFFTAHPIGEL